MTNLARCVLLFVPGCDISVRPSPVKPECPPYVIHYAPDRAVASTFTACMTGPGVWCAWSVGADMVTCPPMERVAMIDQLLCQHGPSVAGFPAETKNVCAAFDFDGSGTVDLADWAMWAETQ